MRALLVMAALAACASHAARDVRPDVVHEDWTEHDPVADPTHDLVRPAEGATLAETVQTVPPDPTIAVWDRVAATAMAIAVGGWGPLFAWEVQF